MQTQAEARPTLADAQRFSDPPTPRAEQRRANVAAPPAGVNPAARRRAERLAAASHRRPLWSALTTTYYHLGRLASQTARYLPLRIEVVRPELVRRQGPFILAVTHLSHLEPCIVSMVVERKIDWIARLEFYRWFVFRAKLALLDAIPVNRFGVPVSAIRTALERLRCGRIVGIFPEGGVTAGRDFVCRGGPMKRGACLLSIRSGVPIIPCVVLGTHELNAVGPWIPFKTIPFRRTPLWMAFGEPIEPPRGEMKSRDARTQQAAALQQAFAGLYAELRERFEIPEESVP